MTERQTRRRRRAVPAASLPRPVSGSAEGSQSKTSTAARGAVPAHHREHHITKDYGYVKKDLLTIVVVGTIVMALMVALAFIVIN